MASLYNRATSFQLSLIRVVEGQVRCFAKEHPEIPLTDRAIRSITKRVVGDIAANWLRLSAEREVL